MNKTYANYINGEWRHASTRKTFEVRNPAHRQQVVAEFQASGGEDAIAAIDAAAKAQDAWASMPPPQRGACLRRAGQALAKRRDEAATTLTREEGKPISEARGEVNRSIALLEYYAAQGYCLNGQTIPSTVPGRLLYTLRSPLGVVGLITPWNFPSAIPVWKAAPALLCGNTVVLKPASLAPTSAAIFAECLHDAQLPPGVFNLVTGSGGEVGDALVLDHRIRGISFTGSLAIGQSIMKKCAGRLIRIGLEMGGKNPHIVMEDAGLDRAVGDVIAGAFWSAGHKCTAASRAIVLAGVYDAFVEKLAQRTSELRVGDGLDEKTQVGPVVCESQIRSILDYVRVGQVDGAKLIVGGQRLTGGIYNEGWYMSPAVFVDVQPTMRIAREEIFGPVLCVMKAKDIDEAIALANDVEYGLSAAISTRSISGSLDFIRRIQAGVVHVNSPTAGLELQVPFGGMKDSSSGYREMGGSALDFYSQTKTVYVDA